MKENNIIQNLGLDTIPKYQYGGFFGPFRMLWDAIFNKEKIEQEKKQKKEDTANVSNNKTASTRKNQKKVTTTRTVSTTNQPETTTSTTPTATGNMDWMSSDYGQPGTTVTEETQETVEKTPFSANDFVWGEDSPLSKVDTGITSRYLKNNLQDLLNMYNIKVAETIGQKRS